LALKARSGPNHAGPPACHVRITDIRRRITDIRNRDMMSGGMRGPSARLGERPQGRDECGRKGCKSR